MCNLFLKAKIIKTGWWYALLITDPPKTSFSNLEDIKTKLNVARDTWPPASSPEHRLPPSTFPGPQYTLGITDILHV